MVPCEHFNLHGGDGDGDGNGGGDGNDDDGGGDDGGVDEVEQFVGMQFNGCRGRRWSQNTHQHHHNCRTKCVTTSEHTAEMTIMIC